MEPLDYLNRSIASHEPGWPAGSSFEEVLAYFESTAPGLREAYEREFGRAPDPSGVAELVSRETGGLDVNRTSDAAHLQHASVPLSTVRSRKL